MNLVIFFYSHEKFSCEMIRGGEVAMEISPDTFNSLFVNLFQYCRNLKSLKAEYLS